MLVLKRNCYAFVFSKYSASDYVATTELGRCRAYLHISEGQHHTATDTNDDNSAFLKYVLLHKKCA